MQQRGVVLINCGPNGTELRSLRRFIFSMLRWSKRSSSHRCTDRAAILQSKSVVVVTEPAKEPRKKRTRTRTRTRTTLRLF